MESGSDSSFVSVASEEQQMKIFLKLIKTIELNVNRSDCVSDLKASLCEKEGISQPLQELFFSGKRLEDEQKLLDCGIQENSTLNVFVQNSGVVKLYVTIVSKKTTVEIEAKSKETVETIKKSICSKEGLVLSHQYSLYSAGTLLDDSRTLASLGIKSESTLHMVFSTRDVLSVTVEFPDGKTVKAEAKMSFSVMEFKSLVGSIVGFPVEGHYLSFLGEELNYQKTLACYNLKEDSAFKIMPDKIVVTVKVNWTQESCTLSIGPTETLADLRKETNRILQLSGPYKFKFGDVSYE